MSRLIKFRWMIVIPLLIASCTTTATVTSTPSPTSTQQPTPTIHRLSATDPQEAVEYIQKNVGHCPVESMNAGAVVDSIAPQEACANWETYPETTFLECHGLVKEAAQSSPEAGIAGSGWWDLSFESSSGDTTALEQGHGPCWALDTGGLQWVLDLPPIEEGAVVWGLGVDSESD